MIIFTSVWGAEYVGYFERGLVASFKFPENKKSIQNAHWIVCCRDADDRKKITEIVNGMVATVEFLDMELYQGVKYAVQAAQASQQPFLMAPPDNVFSDGSIRNFLQVASQRWTCVASAHVRVLPSYLDEGLKYQTPREMVAHAWRHLHGSWAHSNVKNGPSVSFHGGVFFQKLEPKMIAVQHRLPTIFMSNITADDVHFFKKQVCLGVWDNIWPPVCLINQQRYRYLGSSDAGFVVEITHPGRNVPMIKDVDPHEPDAFYGNALHNWMNREFVTIMNSSEEFP